MFALRMPPTGVRTEPSRAERSQRSQSGARILYYTELCNITLRSTVHSERANNVRGAATREATGGARNEPTVTHTHEHILLHCIAQKYGNMVTIRMEPPSQSTENSHSQRPTRERARACGGVCACEFVYGMSRPLELPARQPASPPGVRRASN